MATAAILLAGSVTTAAADAGAPVRIVADASRDAGPAATDADPADVVAPVTDDAAPVAPTVEVADLDDAQVAATPESFAEVVAPDPHAEGSSDTEATDEPSAHPDDPADGGEPDEVSLVTTGDGGSVVSFLSPTPELAVVGVSWALGSAPADLQISWRSESSTGWTDWEEVHVELTDAPDEGDVDAATRDGAAPIAVVDAGAVEIQMASASGALPEDVTVGVVDPGEASADASVDASSAGTADSSVLGGGVGGGTRLSPVGPAPMDNAPGAARPTIHSRAQWGADESMMTWTPSQGRVQGIDIHHTVNANDYSSAQVPGLIRGIYAYHAQDWGRGWGDIGYNFLVDRFGRIWEGRYGGVTAAPIGAHATGLNSNMSGISLLGNFEITPVPAAAFTAVAKLAAWKLWLHGVTSPHGTITLDAGRFNRISGHRDAKQTTCPGRYMYNRLPEMRNRIASYIGSFSSRVLDRDVDGDGYPDLLTYSAGQVGRISTVDQGVWYRAALTTGFNADRTTAAGDLTGDGHPDVVRLTSSGVLQLLPGTSTNRVGSPRTVATGWPTDRMIVGGADLTGDGRPDLVVRRGNGTLWIYPFVSPTRLGTSFRLGTSSGWGNMDRITIAPRFVGSETVILGENRNGSLYGYRLTKTGAYKSRFVVSSTWSKMSMTTGLGDVTGDGRGDVVSIDTSGRMWTMPGTGSGGLSTSRREPLDVGRQRVNDILPVGYSTNKLSIWTIGNTNNLVINRFVTDVQAYRTPAATGVPMATGDRPVVVGDWNRDGDADIVLVRANGDVRLHLGDGDGTFASSYRRMAVDFDRWEGILGSGDFRGDGRTGLLTWDRQSGRVFYYPATTTGLAERVLVSDAADGMDYFVNAGQFNGRGVPDLLLRGADSKRLFFYNGNGPGLALSPTVISSGWGSRSSIIGVGDVTFDGKADLVYQTTGGVVVVARGDGTGRFSMSFQVGSRGSGATALW